MSLPFELICHHTYSAFGGAPVDLTDHDNHGYAVGTAFDANGASTGSGAVRFVSGNSRIRIPAGGTWDRLGGFKVEATIRRSSTTGSQTIVAGHNSFTLKLTGLYLFAYFHGPSTIAGWANFDGLDSFTDAADFQPHPVPAGQWITVSFVHDGLGRAQLFFDGQLVAERTKLLAAIPPVGPKGVSIGNEPDRDDSRFTGSLDEIKFWRVNPHTVDSQFFARPVTPDVAECWRRFFEALREALARDPDCARYLQTLPEILNRLWRTIHAAGPETHDRFNETTREYHRLWTNGDLDGQEMARLLADWCTWLRLKGISFGRDPDLLAFLQSECVKRVMAGVKAPDCDPAFVALIDRVVQGCGTDVGNRG